MLERIARAALPLCLIGLCLAAGGCSTEDERALSRHAELLAAGEPQQAAALFHVDVQLWGRTAGTRWRLPAVDRAFAVRDESHIKAEVTLENLRPRRTYSVHLVWIRPDGREMFRRYAEVTRHEIGLPAGVTPDTSGGLPADLVGAWRERFGGEVAAELGDRLAATPNASLAVHEIVYKKALDLAFAQRRLEVAAEPRAILDSRLNISRERERTPGQYALRVYLDRRLLREVPFQITD